MAERRALIEGIRKPEMDRQAERQFVHGEAVPAPIANATQPSDKPRPPKPAGRAPLTTRIRADLAEALKRATLQRQLEGVEPHTVQEILEEVLEPWLKNHGYLNG
jgi:hypothetical protein